MGGSDVWALSTTGLLFAAMARPQDTRQDPAEASRATIARYCTGCHNERTRAGALVLNPQSIASPPETWEKVVRRLRMRTMPPSPLPRPDEETYNQTVAWMEGQLDRAAAASPNPGQPLLHRLNRTEYANAIEDLLGLKVDVAALLPPDDWAFGFDNNASVLQHIEGLPFGTVGGMLVEHTFPLDAEYEFQLSFFRNNLEIMRGIERPHQVELAIDDERIFLRTIGGPDDLASMRNPTDGSDAIDARFRIRIPVKAGLHKVTATFLQKRGLGTLRSPGIRAQFRRYVRSQWPASSGSHHDLRSIQRFKGQWACKPGELPVCRARVVRSRGAWTDCAAHRWRCRARAGYDAISPRRQGR